MGRYFAQDEVFPVIARLIREEHAKRQVFITHEDLVTTLSNDALGQKLLDSAASRDTDGRSLEWWASNMVQWFSEKFTEGTSEYVEEFDRKQEKGGWAYKPRTRPPLPT